MKYLLCILSLCFCLVGCDNGDPTVEVNPDVALIKSFQGNQSTTQTEIVLLAEAPATMDLRLLTGWAEYGIPAWSNTYTSANKYFVKQYCFDMGGKLVFSNETTPVPVGRVAWKSDKYGHSISGLSDYQILTALVCENPLGVVCRSTIKHRSDIQ